MANPKVYFDVQIGGQAAGRITFELFADVVIKLPILFFVVDLYNSSALNDFIRYRKQPRTFEHSAPVKRGREGVERHSTSKGVFSTASLKVFLLLYLFYQRLPVMVIAYCQLHVEHVVFSLTLIDTLGGGFQISWSKEEVCGSFFCVILYYLPLSLSKKSTSLNAWIVFRFYKGQWYRRWVHLRRNIQCKYYTSGVSIIFLTCNTHSLTHLYLTGWEFQAKTHPTWTSFHGKCREKY